MDFFDDLQGTDDALLTNKTLIDTQEKLGALLDLMPTGLIIHQLQGILYANQQALALFEENYHDIIGKHILDFVEDSIREQSTEMFMSAFQQDKPVRFPEIHLQVPSGVKRILQVTAGRLPWEGTTVIQILLEDITELKWQAEELRKLTFSDPLTGAYNRRFFIQNAEIALHKSIREEKAFSLLTFDVDWFKKVNDTYGHLAGDEALKTITRVWNETTRHSDDKNRGQDSQLARIGGEEFAVFFPGLSTNQAHGIAERMRQNLAETKIAYDNITFSISASFGVTTRLDGDRTIDDLIRRADRALYRAKENGRNRVECE
ncbi:MAG: GGDEF domain-containing protein [Terasakiella sp.]|uniref:GGDEF domain-containing protein n=1 Tax=unclassified Terasakiella TaxID=2614952 RepID=UPI003B001101